MPDATAAQEGGPPDFTELLARAEALVPVLRERAARTKELRRLPDETIKDLHRTGLFRIRQPRRVGGSELPFRTLVELVSVIGRGDGSTAGCWPILRPIIGFSACGRNGRRTRCGANPRTI